jgi:arylsulfatase A-like enzyme
LHSVPAAAAQPASHATDDAMASAKQRPNVVVFLADDLGWSDLGCYGSEFYETPRIDRLAAQGMRFTDAYASCPVCSPSRAALMTGRNPARIGLTAHIGAPGPNNWNRDTPLLPATSLGQLPLSEVTLAEVLHDAGYATMNAGKWHLGSEEYWPEYQGFDVNAGGWSQGGPFGGKQYFSPYGNPRLADGPEGEHLPDRLATETARFIHAHRHEPFFVQCAWYSVHVPLVAREDLLKKYEHKLGDRVGALDEMIETPDGLVRRRQDLPVYAAMVEAMDEAVGKVLAALEEAGVADNTIILFTSDNGGLSTGDIAISPAEGWPTTNAPLRAGKGWLYEGGIRVPLIVKAPRKVRSGTVSKRIATGADLFTTVLDLVGVSKPDGPTLDSESFAPALSGDHAPRSAAFWHYPHYGNQGGRPGAAVRDGDWKLIEWYAPSAEETEVELYDLASDLSESHNLANSEPARRDAMRMQLDTWRKSINAVMPSTRTKLASRKSLPSGEVSGQAGR